MEMYKDDWNRVCEHIGSRTQEECILHFLRLPIEDPYLEESNGGIGAMTYQPIPFSKTGNPIMSTVAFLASAVDPRVASSAAKAALDEFSKMKDEVPPALIDAHMKSIEAARKDGKSVDASYGLEKSGIAGTIPEKEEEEKEGEVKKEEGKTEVKQEKVDDETKKDEPMETEGEKKEEDKEKSEKEGENVKEEEKKDESAEGEKEKKEDGEKGEEKEEEKGEGEKEGEKSDKSERVTHEALDPKNRRLEDECHISTAAASALASAAVKAKVSAWVCGCW